MKVLIISTNRNRQPLTVMPYGACVAAQTAFDAGHEVRFLDLMFEKNPAGTLENACRTFQPDVAGFSLRNIDNNDLLNPVSFFDETASLIALARRSCSAAIVLGGAALPVMPEALLRHTGADWGVLGDAVAVFPQLLSALAEARSPLGIPGVCAIGSGGLAGKPPEFSSCLGEELFPEFSQWIDIKAYRSQMAALPLKTKLGCPFGCVYCTYPAGEGKSYRLCPPETVLRRVKKLVAGGIRDIEFVDNVFNSPYGHATELCSLLAANNTGARFHTMELNPGFIDTALLSLMEKAGFASIGITAESADDGVLAALGKNYDRAGLEKAAATIAAHTIPCLWIFMLGGPGETRQTVEHTLDFARRRIKPSDTVFFNIGVRIYPGAALEATARREGTLHLPPEEMLAPVFYVSSGVDRDYLAKTLGEALDANMNFIDSTSLALPFLPAMFKMASRCGMKPPLWKHTRVLRKGLRALGIRA